MTYFVWNFPAVSSVTVSELYYISFSNATLSLTVFFVFQAEGGKSYVHTQKETSVPRSVEQSFSVAGYLSEL